MTVRRYSDGDRAEWLRMRAALWPGSSLSAAERDANVWLARPDAVVLIAVADAGSAGFAEAGERVYADGCDTSPVAFLEGWYVEPALRGQGIGLALVQAVEAWASARGCTELASDALLEDIAAQKAHRASGFAEVERSVKYRKLIARSNEGA